MKNGQIPDHWQLWLWIGIAALILAALARQSAIDTGGMSTFNANLVFGGIIALFGLLYLALHEFLSKKFGTLIVSGLESFFRWLGLKEKQPLQEITEPEPISLPAEPIQQPVQHIEPISPAETIESDIVKIETPTPRKIIIDYEERKAQHKQKQEDRAYQKEENVIKYIGYTLAPLVELNVLNKIIDAVTAYIHTEGVPEFYDDEAIELPDTLTTMDMMHFGWNIAKPFKKPNPHTAHFLKQVFAHKFKDVEVCTIERKLKYQGSQGTIKINENVARFEIPADGEELDTDKGPTTVKKTKTSKSTPKKETKSKKSSSRANNLNPAMIAAYADMDIQPYNLGDNILEDDGYSDPMW